MPLKHVKVGKIYRNSKNELLYRVLAVGFHTENEEITVRYSPLYDGAGYSEYYRPLYGSSGFLTKFELPVELHNRETAARLNK